MDIFTLLFPNTQLNRIERKLDILMAQVQIAQEDLDAFATEIQTSVDAVAAEIQALVDSPDNTLTDADTTALKAAVDNLKALEPPTVTPVE